MLGGVTSQRTEGRRDRKWEGNVRGGRCVPWFDWLKTHQLRQWLSARQHQRRASRQDQNLLGSDNKINGVRSCAAMPPNSYPSTSHEAHTIRLLVGRKLREQTYVRPSRVFSHTCLFVTTFCTQWIHEKACKSCILGWQTLHDMKIG